MQAPICLCLLGPHLSLPTGYMSPSVFACWICVPVCLCMLGMSLCPLLPLRYESFSTSPCWVPVPICLHLLDSCPLSIPACWACVPSCLCLLDVRLHLSLPTECLSLPVECPSVSASICWVPVSTYWVPICSSAAGLAWGFPLQARREDEGGRGQPIGSGEGGRERKGT